MYSSAAARYKAAVREYVHAKLVAASYWDFHALQSPAISGTGDGSFRRSPLVEFGVGARSFADNTLYGRVGRAWSGHAAAGGPVALGRAVPKRGILKHS